MSWNDMACGVRAFKLAFLLERLRRGELTPTAQDEADLFALVDAHASFLSLAANVPDNNHGLIMAVGLRHLSRQGSGRPSCEAGVERSAEHLSRVIAGQYSDEGIHREHSPGYHFYVTDVLTWLRVAELFPEVEGVPEIVRRAEANRAWIVFPNGEVSRIGDNRRTGEPLTETRSTRVVGGREYAVGDFTRTGYAIVRTFGDVPLERQSMLFMTAMSNSRVHKHADDGKPLASVRPPRRSEVRLVQGQKDPLLGWETIERRVMAPAFVLEACRRDRNLSMEWRLSILHG
jgi:hypothetical protein